MEVYFWQSPKSKKTHGGLQAVTAVMAGQSQAAVVSATFLSTADNSEGGGANYVDNVSFGDQVKIVIAMDNGGSTLFNQTWNASDVLSVTQHL
jgi:hypothetical protein